MYKLITSARNTDDLSIGFDRDRERRKRELTNNKNMKGKYHMIFSVLPNTKRKVHMVAVTN